MTAFISQNEFTDPATLNPLDHSIDHPAHRTAIDVSDRDPGLGTAPAAALNGPHGEGHTVLTARVQAAFLESLQHFGNVRLACRQARISAQTAYRGRRRSAAFARAWDAALLAARCVAEATLADRAIHGVEEPVFYHGEEIARRRRYDSRLLLAHLARLDRLEEREEVAAMLPELDDCIDALRRGEELEDQAALAQDGAGDRAGDRKAEEEKSQEGVPPVPSCRECGGRCEDENAELTPADCQWLGNRLERMDAARPADAEPVQHQTTGCADAGEVEQMQLIAFEAGLEEWWLITEHDDWEAAMAGLADSPDGAGAAADGAEADGSGEAEAGEV